MASTTNVTAVKIIVYNFSDKKYIHRIYQISGCLGLHTLIKSGCKWFSQHLVKIRSKFDQSVFSECTPKLCIRLIHVLLWMHVIDFQLITHSSIVPTKSSCVVNSIEYYDPQSHFDHFKSNKKITHSINFEKIKFFIVYFVNNQIKNLSNLIKNIICWYCYRIQWGNNMNYQFRRITHKRVRKKI